jgi:carboxyl-terminal processing protease
MKITRKFAALSSFLPSVNLGAVLTISALAAGCGSGSGSLLPELPGITTPITSESEPQALKSYMQDYYLWYKELANVDVSGLKTAEEALEKLAIKPKDRFSYIDTQANQNAFFEEGQAVGAGFGMVEKNNQTFINYVRPGSPAETAGLKRADRIITANGTAITTPASADVPIGPREAGVKLDMTVERAGQTVNLTMVKAKYPIVTVSDSKVIDVGGRKVGYLYFFAFIRRTADDWTTTVNQLKAQGAQDLIVDLRHNGGGYLDTAGQISGSLRTTAQNGSEPLTTLTFNDKHSRDNSTTFISTNSSTPRFGKVIFLTTAASCSASEALINGLAPFQPTVIIGTTTCGKPVGFTPREYGSTKVFSIVTFELVNRDKSGNYFDGLKPTCTVDEVLTGSFGDPTEPLLAAASTYLRSGSCPLAANGATTKALTSGAEAVFGRSAGVNRRWGLY